MPNVRVFPAAATEGRFVDVDFHLDAPSPIPATVPWAIVAGGARLFQDYPIANGLVRFAPGETSKTVQIALIDDATAEPTESFWIDLGGVDGVTQRYTPVIIFDNDGAPGVPWISVSDAAVDETARIAKFFVSLSGPSTTEVSVGFATRNDSAEAGSDYIATAGRVSFAPGERVKTVSVPIVDDRLAERDEFFALELAGANGATLGDASGTGLIGRNDDPGVEGLTVISFASGANEGEPWVTFVVQLTRPWPWPAPVQVRYTIGRGSAGADTDFIYPVNDSPFSPRRTDTLVFAPGETTKTVVVSLLDDDMAESVETLWLELVDVQTTFPFVPAISQRFTPALIYDNDGSKGTPAVSVGDVVVDETEQTVRFTVRLDRPSAGLVEVGYATLDDTAKAGQDYEGVAGVLRFAPGERVRTATVALINDTAAETDEHFQLLLTSVTGATLADSVGIATVGRNDMPPVTEPHVSVRSVAVSEGEGIASFVIQLSAQSSTGLGFWSSPADGTAALFPIQEQDYEHRTEVGAFGPGQTTKVVPIGIFDDTSREAIEGFSLLVSTQFAIYYGTVLIFDNDGVAGVPSASVGDAVLDETEQTASFFVWLDKPFTGTVSVDYAAASDTARAGTDFIHTAGSLTFAPGERVKMVTVDVVDDQLAEGDERFELLLSNPRGMTLADSIGSALIARSDTVLSRDVRVFATPLVVSEGDAMAVFAVQLSAPSYEEVRVVCFVDSIRQPGAVPSLDMETISSVRTLVFSPGETMKRLPILLINDAVAEPTETFQLHLLAATHAVIPQAYIEATIIDDDSGYQVFSRGIGNDSYHLSSALDRIAEGPRGGIDTVFVDFSYTLPQEVENLVLGGSATTGTGNSANNVMRGNSANNTFDGQGGIDTAVFGAPLARYAISGTLSTRTVTGGGDGSDTLISFERLQFADTIQAFDTGTDGNTYLAYAMLNAGFDRAPSTRELSQWTAELDRLGNLRDVAQAMINHYAAGIPDDAFVTYLWGTIVETPIPADMLRDFSGLLASGTQTQASLLELVTLNELNTAEIVNIVGQPLILDPAYFPPPG